MYVLVTLIIGLFNFSRAFLLALAVFFTLNFLYKYNVIQKLKKPKLLTYIFYLVILILISIYYVEAFQQSNYSYRYISGFERYLNYLDISNYIRFETNLIALRSLLGFSSFIGADSGTFLALDVFR